MSRIPRPHGGRPRGIEIQNREQLRYDLARIGERATLARRLQLASEADTRRPNRKYPYLPQAATIWQWLDSGRKVAWPGHALRDLARFIGEQTAKPCDWEAWVQVPACSVHLWGAPRAPSCAFRGREAELGELRALFASERSTAAFAAIEGLPGVGKTELALHVAHAFAADAARATRAMSVAGIFWFDAQQRDLTAAWDEIARSCFHAEGGTVQERVARLLHKLERSAEPVLLILDNAFLAPDERWEKGRGQPYPLPAGAQIHLLVTTRNEYFGGTAFHHHSLGMLSGEASRALLLDVAQRDPERDTQRLEGLDALLDALGGHALSLEVGGVYLHKNGGETPRSLLQRLERGDRLERHARHTGYAVHKSAYESTIHSAFAALWDSLDAATQDSWRLASQFEPAPVSVALSAAVGLRMEALEALHDFHLIDWDASGARWLMHRLTRAFGEQTGDAASRSAARRAFVTGCARRAAQDSRAYARDPVHFDLAIERAPGVVDVNAELDLLFSIGPAVTAHQGVSEKPRRLYERAIRLAEQVDRHEEVFLGLEGIWHGSLLRGDLKEAGELAQRLQECAELRGSIAQRLTAYRAMAETCWHRGALAESCSWLDRGIALAQQERSPTYRTILHPATALLGRAGLTYWLVGAPERGFALSTQAVELAREIGDAATLALAQMQRSLLQQWRGALDASVDDAAQALELARASDVAIPGYIAQFQLAWSRIVRDPAASEGELAAMYDGIEQLQRRKFRVFLVFHACALADACMRVGRRAEAMRALETGLGHLRAKAPAIFESELWRLRAALAESRSERATFLERAAGLARNRGARWFQLRACTDLLAAQEHPELRGRTAAELGRLCAEFPDGSVLPELTRARTALLLTAP